MLFENLVQRFVNPVLGGLAQGAIAPPPPPMPQAPAGQGFAPPPAFGQDGAAPLGGQGIPAQVGLPPMPNNLGGDPIMGGVNDIVQAAQGGDTAQILAAVGGLLARLEGLFGGGGGFRPQPQPNFGPAPGIGPMPGFNPPQPQPLNEVNPAGPPAGDASARVLALVNAERAKAGVAPLQAEPRLDKVAQDFSDDMARRGYFDHQDPEGRSPSERIQAAGIAGGAAENIAMGQQTPEEAVRSWMESPGHRQNLLDPNYKFMGLGVADGGDGRKWTQVFT